MSAGLEMKVTKLIKNLLKLPLPKENSSKESPNYIQKRLGRGKKAGLE